MNKVFSILFFVLVIGIVIFQYSRNTETNIKGTILYIMSVNIRSVTNIIFNLQENTHDDQVKYQIFYL